jgi:hypothetical protein
MNNFIDSIKTEIIEATYGDIKKKQADVVKLFPPFYDRVDAVRLKGGMKMVGMDKSGWAFQVHSGTDEGNKWYDVTLKFLGVPEVLRYASKEVGIWKKEQTGVNLSKLAQAVMYNVDIRVKCSCPADLYWGKHYIRSQEPMDAMVPPPEDRYPIVRNPKLYAAHCKHIQLVMNLLPMYHGTFAKWLKTHYLSDIVSAEKVAKKEGYREEEREEAAQGKESPEGEIEKE